MERELSKEAKVSGQVIIRRPAQLSGVDLYASPDLQL